MPPKQSTAAAAAGEAAAEAAVEKPEAAKEAEAAKSEVNKAEVKTEAEIEMVRRIPRLTPAQVRAQQQAFNERQMREIWEWVEDVVDADTDITNSNVQHAYRLHFDVHEPYHAACKKNCRGNPRCYACLAGAILDEDSDEDDEIEEFEAELALERRDKEMPAGLKNLGNTCYVNSFLQIWFHNVPFRQALYDWDPEEDEAERENDTLLMAERYEPVGTVATLQALFSMMEFTNRRAVDPAPLIAKLALDPLVQQDAQEFSKLFMSLLENSLSEQKTEGVRTVVQTQFRGEYAYVTKCLKCKKESCRPSHFYELDLALQGKKTLDDCLADFTKEEKLTGDNQYLCAGCESKQDATRCVRLKDLPPVLNLQLNRFIFDMQTGNKKKLNSQVQFPEELDMSKFLREPEGSQVYHLTGVLMHVGSDANHGHYLAHIQEAHTADWYKFSDVQVERLSGKNLKLGNENDPMVATPLGPIAAKKAAAKGPKVLKGYHSSNNAYMLVYTEQKTLEGIRDEELERATVKERVKQRAIKEAKRKERAKKRERLKRKWEMEEEEERAMLAECSASKRLKAEDGKAVDKVDDGKAVTKDDDGKARAMGDDGKAVADDEKTVSKVNDGKALATANDGKAVVNDGKTESNDRKAVAKVEAPVSEEPKKEAKDEPKEECGEPKKEEEEPKKPADISSATQKTEETSVVINNSCPSATAFTGTISLHEDGSDADVCEGTCCLGSGDGLNTTTTDDDEEDEFFEDMTSSDEDEDEDDDDMGDPYDYVYVNSLVYPSSFPIYLRAYIENDRRVLEEELEEMVLVRREECQERQALRKRIGEVIHQMPFYTRSELTGYSEDEDEDEDEDDDDIEGFIGNFQFLPTEWLQKYFDTPTAAPMIDTSPYLCPHGRLDLDNITQVKAVNYDVAEMLYEEAGKGMGRKLTPDALCDKCVKNRCRQIKLHRDSVEDAKLVTLWLKEPVPPAQESGGERLFFWVGKETLKRWRAIAKADLDEDIQEEFQMDMMIAEEEEEMDMDDDDDDEDDDEDEDDSDEEREAMMMALYEHNKRMEEERRKRAALEKEGGEDKEDQESNKEKAEQRKAAPADDDDEVMKMEVEEDVAVDPDVVALKAALEEENAAAPTLGRAKRSSTAAATKASNAAARSTRSTPSRLPNQPNNSEQPPSEVTLNDVQNKLSRIGTNISVSTSSAMQTTTTTTTTAAMQTTTGKRGRRSSSSSSAGKSAKRELPSKDENATEKSAGLVTKSEKPSEFSEAVKNDDHPADQSAEPKSPSPKGALSNSNGALTPQAKSGASMSIMENAAPLRRRQSSSSSSKGSLENGDVKMSNGICGGFRAINESEGGRKGLENGESNVTTAVIKREESNKNGRETPDPSDKSETVPRVPGRPSPIVRPSPVGSPIGRPVTNGHTPVISSPPPHNHRHPHHNRLLNPHNPHFVPQDRFRFNSDLMCPHGNLCTQEGRRRLVPEKIWRTLRKYFQYTRPFPRKDSRACSACVDAQGQVAAVHEERKDRAQAQRSALSDILNERNRPSWAKASLNKVYLIPRQFVRAWRQFVQRPLVHEPITDVNNGLLLCEHKGLVYPLDLDTESDYESVIYMVSEEEWSVMKGHFSFDAAIVVTRTRSGPQLLSSEPAVCVECVNRRKEEEEREKLKYSRVPVFVRLLTGADKDPDPKDPDFENGTVSSSSDSTPAAVVNGDSSAAATSSGGPVKGKNHITPNGVTVVPNGGLIRRSNRRQKVRGEKEVIVSSDMLLRDLKVKIMELFKIAPFDQILRVESSTGSSLLLRDDNVKTLGQLKVLPRSLIYLRADDMAVAGSVAGNGAGASNGFKGGGDGEPWSLNHLPEEGFKGTGLLSGF